MICWILSEAKTSCASEKAVPTKFGQPERSKTLRFFNFLKISIMDLSVICELLISNTYISLHISAKYINKSSYNHSPRWSYVSVSFRPKNISSSSRLPEMAIVWSFCSFTYSRSILSVYQVETKLNFYSLINLSFCFCGGNYGPITT